MRNYLIFIFIFCVNFNSFAQDLDLVLGEEHEMKSRNYEFAQIIGQDNSGFYVYKKTDKNSFVIEHLNSKMNITKSTISVLKYGYELMFVEYISNKIYVFSTFFDKQNNLSKVYVHSINKFSLKQNNDYICIAEIETNKAITRKLFKYQNFDYTISPDSTKLCLFFEPKNYSAHYYAYDGNMNFLWKKTLNEDENYYPEEYYIDNEGNLHELIPVYENNEIYYELLSYTENATIVKQYNLKIKNNTINALKLGFTKENNIICAGFYGKYYGIIGTCFFLIDNKKNEISHTNYEEFSIDLQTIEFRKRRRERYIKKNKQNYLSDYRFDYLNIYNNNVCLVVEKRYSTTTTGDSFSDPTSTSRSSRRTKTEYHNDNIIILQLDSVGELVNEKAILKRQTSSYRRTTYSQAIINNKINVLLNSKNDIVIKEITKKGKINNNFVLSNQTFVWLSSVNMKQISNNELIIWGEKKRIQQFIKLTFKNN